MIISPGRIPQPLASSSLEAPISMNISLISYGLFRVSGLKTWGGFEPTTPWINLPSLVLISTCCASITCPHQPPRVWNSIKPFSVILVTIKPTSSICPDIKIFGPPPSPTCLAMTLPKPSKKISSAKSLAYSLKTSRTSSSFPGTPRAVVRSIKSCSSFFSILLPPLAH